MKVRALRSFSGMASMSRGQIADLADTDVVKDLLRAGYVEALAEEEEKPQTAAGGKKKKGSEAE